MQISWPDLFFGLMGLRLDHVLAVALPQLLDLLGGVLDLVAQGGDLAVAGGNLLLDAVCRLVVGVAEGPEVGHGRQEASGALRVRLDQVRQAEGDGLVVFHLEEEEPAKKNKNSEGR